MERSIIISSIERVVIATVFTFFVRPVVDRRSSDSSMLEGTKWSSARYTARDPMLLSPLMIISIR